MVETVEKLWVKCGKVGTLTGGTVRTQIDGPGETGYGPPRFTAAPEERTPQRSDLESHAHDRLSDDTQAGVVVAGVPSHELVGLIDWDRVLMGGDPLGLFDDDP